MSNDTEMSLYGPAQHEEEDTSFNYYGEAQHDKEVVNTERLAYEEATSAEASEAWGDISTPTSPRHSRRENTRIDYADSGAD